MKNLLKQAALIAVVGLALTSCKKNEDEISTPVTSYGSYVNVGSGKARTFVVNNADGSVKEIGFKFSETALSGLPAENTSFVLPMPAGNNTVINHISFDYSVKGSQLNTVYNTPHFETHFYLITEQEKNSITLTDPKIDVLPASEDIPKNYFPIGNEAKMGKHWADSTAAEFHGKDFTSTFIYGSYNGKFIFLEPMIALNYLKTKPNVNLKITPLARVAASAQLPEQYAIQWEKDLQEYTVSFNQF